MSGRTPEIPFSLFSMILQTDQFLLGYFRTHKLSCSGLSVGRETQLSGARGCLLIYSFFL